jgi:hypothetical protein
VEARSSHDLLPQDCDKHFRVFIISRTASKLKLFSILMMIAGA